MIAENFTLENYIHSTTEIVREHYEEKHLLREFMNDLDILRDESVLLRDTIKIMKALKTGIAEELRGNYNKNEFRELLGTSVQGSEGRYCITLNREKIEFILCEHKIFSPLIQINRTQCLNC